MADRRKNIAKSIRMTEEVYGYIDAVPGNGFAEKLERLVMETRSKDPELPRHLADLEARIKERADDLQDLWSKTVLIDCLIDDLNEISSRIENLKEYVDVITDFDGSRAEQMPRMEDEVPGKKPPDDSLLIL